MTPGRIWIPPPGVTLPRRFDLKPNVFTVDTQGTAGDCTAYGLKEPVEEVLIVKLSSRFNFFWSRLLENRMGAGGALPRSAFVAGEKYGLCLESLCTSVDSEMEKMPSALAIADGAARRIKDWLELDTRKVGAMRSPGEAAALRYAIKAWIYLTQTPVVFASVIGRQMLDLSGPWETHRMAPVAYGMTTSNAYFADHQQVIIGWDDDIQDPCIGFNGAGSWLVQGSWGPGWADGGFYGHPMAALDYDIKFAGGIASVGSFAVPPARLYPEGWIDEATVRAWYADTNFVADDPGVRYWMDPANGGARSFYGTLKALTDEKCDLRLAQL